jgi:hypothetical protein
MKNKTKLVLGLSILTAAALTAGATGTFAWFTTNRKATATFNHITAQSVEGSLTIMMGTITDEREQTNGYLVTTDSNAATTTATLNGTSKTTDVSSQDGVTFTRPNWVSAITAAENGISGVTDVSSLNDYGKKGYWTAYYVALKNSGGKNADVYLDQGSEISAANDEAASKSAASWTRVAINVAGTSKPEKPALATNGSKTLLMHGTADTKAKYVALDSTLKTYTETAIDPSKVTVLGATLSDVVSAAKADTIANQKVVTISAGDTRYLTVSVWLEGTATGTDGNQDSAISGMVNVKLNFAARTVE